MRWILIEMHVMQKWTFIPYFPTYIIAIYVATAATATAVATLPSKNVVFGRLGNF